MYIPKQIKVGGIKYSVTVVAKDELDEKAGALIDVEKCAIKVMKANPQFMEQAFLHEIMHAINMEFKEETVEFLAQALYQVIVDNPRIFQEVKHGD